MVTFNTDSLDFKDDEEVRTGTENDFATRFSSANDVLEIADLVNATTSHIPRNIDTDLIGGKFAQTVAEGKVLADDGNVYDRIQRAVDNADSWVKIGPGKFSGDITVDKQGMTITGSSNKTVIHSEHDTSSFNIAKKDVTIKSMKFTGHRGVNPTDSEVAINGTVADVLSECKRWTVATWDGNSHAPGWSAINNVAISGDRPVNGFPEGLVVGNHLSNALQEGIFISGSDTIIAHNIIENTGDESIRVSLSSSENVILYGNIVKNTDKLGIDVKGNSIVAKNRLINTDGITSDESTILSANLVTQ